jgi:hypothetical protein
MTTVVAALGGPIAAIFSRPSQIISSERTDQRQQTPRAQQNPCFALVQPHWRNPHRGHRSTDRSQLPQRPEELRGQDRQWKGSRQDQCPQARQTGRTLGLRCCWPSERPSRPTMPPTKPTARRSIAARNSRGTSATSRPGRASCCGRSTCGEQCGVWNSEQKMRKSGQKMENAGWQMTEARWGVEVQSNRVTPEVSQARFVSHDSDRVLGESTNDNNGTVLRKGPDQADRAKNQDECVRQSLLCEMKTLRRSAERSHFRISARHFAADC